ncbi:hypothetical protein VZT92_004828 [Zoarces viviparus]|uniref:Secreted protein n=1 Tax=Zoarces viviparus TaxID=48416 RepID=A0AAW1FRP0_ZOAVI
MRPVGSPWPLLLCRRKKSLLLSVTQSFRAFFSRTSSGFSHMFSFQQGVELEECPPPSRSSAAVKFLPRPSRGSGAARRCYRCVVSG